MRWKKDNFPIFSLKKNVLVITAGGTINICSDEHHLLCYYFENFEDTWICKTSS